ncbi:hypothetical protein HMN09_00362500 [Mycena chlorophos]|uniref:Uncharacterized protein n=1 Tax=Mycena chlorophos TaxID=658473 RepID=A0A8H6TJ64_MYCCL|nr:hypothetical protein HMN09_00362500 [Mycena chlorophos]
MDEPPHLPPELERRIFEMAAVSDPGSIPRSLGLVAKRVWEWTEPIIYRTVVISSMNEKTGVAAAILRHLDAGTTSKPPSFFAQHVHNFSLVPSFWLFMAARPSPNAWKPAELARVVRACTGVKNFSFMGSFRPLSAKENYVGDALNAWRPHKILMLADGPAQFAEYATDPVFRDITHLLLTTMSSSSDPDYVFDRPDNLHALARLPKLRHLAVVVQMPTPVLAQLLSAPLQLETLVLFGAENGATELVGIEDDRVVILHEEDNILTDWHEAANGSPDFWDRAGEFIRRKRRGEIESHRFVLSNPRDT